MEEELYGLCLVHTMCHQFTLPHFLSHHVPWQIPVVSGPQLQLSDMDGEPPQHRVGIGYWAKHILHQTTFQLCFGGVGESACAWWSGESVCVWRSGGVCVCVVEWGVCVCVMEWGVCVCVVECVLLT